MLFDILFQTLNMGRGQKAIELSWALLKIYDRIPEVFIFLSEVYFGMRNIGEAKAYALLAKSFLPYDPIVQKLMGMIDAQGGDQFFR